MREGAAIEGFGEETVEVPLLPKKRGMPKGGWPKKRASEVRSAIAAAHEESVRPPVRSSRDEAEEYARQFLNDFGDTIDQTDEFYIRPDLQPDGWSYHWKRESVTGKEDPYHIMDMQGRGWRFVPVERHPELMPPGSTGVIRKKGLVLMELPKILADRAIAKAKKEAIDVQRNADKALHETPRGTAPRDEFPDQYKKLKRTLERPIVSED